MHRTKRGHPSFVKAGVLVKDCKKKTIDPKTQSVKLKEEREEGAGAVRRESRARCACHLSQRLVSSLIIQADGDDFLKQLIVRHSAVRG